MKREKLSYTVARWIIAHFVIPLLMKLEVTGREHVPRQGAYLAVANHLSMVDPPLVMVVLPRTPRVMAKIEIFGNRFLRPFLHWGGAVPVRRSVQDRAALRDAQATLERGVPFAVFPEGTRVRGGKLSAGAPGAGLIALRSKAPVLPIALVGTDKVFEDKRPHLRHKVSVTIGQPISPEELAAAGGLQPATDLMMRRIAEMLPPDMRGVYGEPPAARLAQEGIS